MERPQGNAFIHTREQDFIFRIRIAGETADEARPPFRFPRRLVHKGVGDTALPKNAHFDSNQEATTASLQLIDGIHPRKPKQPAAREQAPNMTGWPQRSPTQKAGTMIPVMCWMDEFANIGLNEVRPRRPKQSYSPHKDFINN